MSLNIMNDDPHYLINNLLEPARQRFIKEDDYRYRFKSYSFGVVYSKTGPAIIDECIREIQRSERNPIRWNELLQKESNNRLSVI